MLGELGWQPQDPPSRLKTRACSPSLFVYSYKGCVSRCCNEGTWPYRLHAPIPVQHMFSPPLASHRVKHTLFHVFSQPTPNRCQHNLPRDICGYWAWILLLKYGILTQNKRHSISFLLIWFTDSSPARFGLTAFLHHICPYHRKRQSTYPYNKWLNPYSVRFCILDQKFLNITRVIYLSLYFIKEVFIAS